jgi:HEAT repeat protein
MSALASLLCRRAAKTPTERLRGLEGAGSAALLAATRDPSVDVARAALARLTVIGRAAERDDLCTYMWICDEAIVGDVARAVRTLGAGDTLGAAAAHLQTGATADRCRAARVLEQLGDVRAVPILRRALADRDASVRGAALDALARLGRGADVGRAVAVLARDGDAGVRRRAIRAVGRCAPREAEQLHAAVVDPVPAVRREIACLAAHLSPEDRGRLLADNDPYVRVTTVEHLGRGTEDALERVLRTDVHPDVRLAAAATLGELGGHGAFEALVRAALDDADATVRARALSRALLAGSSARVAVRLRAALSDSDTRRREMALRWLAKLGECLSVARAAELTRDPDPAVRRALAHTARDVMQDPRRTLALLLCDEDPEVRHAAWLAESR